jgi:hypothetical protein
MEDSMTVTETSGGWSVVAAGVIIKTFSSNAEAWRWIDRHEGETISRSEHVSEWIWSKVSANG